MKKHIFGIALFLVSLALCGTAQAVPELRAMPTPPDTLVLWVMDQDINAGTALQKLMKKYTRQSGIPVKIRFLDWGSAFAELNKVLVNEAGEGNDYPDVLQLGSTWVPYFAKAGLIKPVDEMIDAVDTSRFYPEAMKSAHIGRDSVAYAIPWFLDIRGFFANERIWLELGLHDSEIETYPKFYGVLRAISEAKVANRQGVEVAPFEFGVKEDWTGYQQMSPFLWNFGGDFVVETEKGYRSALADSLTLVGLRHYLKLLRDQELSPNNLKENSAQSADRFVRAEQLIIFGTSELIRKIEFDTDLGGLMDSPLAKDGIITIAGPKGPFGNHSFVGGSHLTLPKNANPIKRNNIDYYSRQCGFIPPDRGLIRIWMQDPRYNHLIEGLENHGRSTQNIPEWSEIEMSVNGMVSAIAASLLKNAPDVDDEIARFVFDTHQKINSILGYNSPETVAAVKERVRKLLLQPVDEFKYAKGLGVVKGASEWSIRLIVVISLGVLAVAMMLVYAFRIRKH